ncbi:hypothetical protein J4463_03880 [Candidatus Pacearchaeota archaeon]|nr:hypothetical protein [Candidatus Pacearchaeota archaeon]
MKQRYESENMRERFERLERETEEAHSRGDNCRYYKLSSVLYRDFGIIPEDRESYEQGLTEEQEVIRIRSLSDLEESASHTSTSLSRDSTNKYQNFLKASEKFMYGDSKKLMSKRKACLREHFPERFGRDGTQEIGGYSDRQTYGLFAHMINYAQKVVDNPSQA